MKSWWLILFIFSVQVLWATDPYIFKTYTTRDGLPSAMVKTAFQDSRGFLWIGSDAGLSRFDGTEFRNYSQLHGLPYNFVTCITEDTAGNLWIGTARGLSRFNGQTFTNYDVQDGLPAGHIRSLAVDKQGNIWIGTSRGLAKWNHGDFTTYLADGDGTSIYALQEHRMHGVLIGTGRGLYKMKNGKLEQAWKPDSRKIIMDIKTRATGHVWLVTLYKELYSWDGRKVRAVKYPHQSHFIASSMARGPNGMFIIGHQRALSVFSGSIYQQELSGFLDSPYNSINSIYVDRDQNLWILTINGLIRAKRSYIQRYACKGKHCVNNFPSLLATGNGDLLAGSNGGQIFARKGDSLGQVFPGKPRQQGEVNAMVEDRAGRYWMATYLGGIVVYNKDTFRHLNATNQLPNNTVWSLMADEVGSVWAGMNNYLVQINGDSVRLFPYPNTNISTMARDDNGNMFVGTNRGIFQFTGKEFRSVSNTTSDLLVNKMVIREGRLIAGTKGQGVVIYDIADSGKIKELGKINTTNGIETNFITNLIFDQHGDLWLGTKIGIYRIKGDLLGGNFLVSRFDEAHGISDNAWGVVSMTNDTGGHLWIGTSNGLYEVNLEEYRGNETTPALHLTNIQIDQQPIGATDTVLGNRHFTSFPENLSLAYHQNDFSFHYTGIDLSNPQNVRYRYKLKNYDTEWSPITDQRNAQYTNLPPGDYTFLLKAMNGDGYWSEEPLTYSFSIMPPFWATWWFRFLVVATIGLLIYLIYRYRVNAIIRQQQEKMRLNEQLMESRLQAFQAQLNPHFIFNSLSSIQHFITNDDKKSALTYLPKFARLLRQVLHNSMETYITLEEELKMIRSYIEMERLRFDNKFDYELGIDENINPDQIEIPGLLLQPYVENAIMHGLLHKDGKGMLRIGIEKDNGQLICTIIDNGIGRAQSKAIQSQRSVNYKSYGMKIARERLGLLNRHQPDHGKVQVEDLEADNGTAAGTKVTIYIALN